MITMTWAQCCRTWPVSTQHPVRECGCCGKRPVVLRALGTFTLRLGWAR